MGRFTRLLSRRLGRQPKTEAPELTAERLKLLEIVVEEAQACYRKEVVAGGTQDLAVLIADARVECVKAWRKVSMTPEAYSTIVALGHVPTVIHPMPRQFLAAHMGHELPQLAQPAPIGASGPRFWAVVITKTGASLAAVDVGEPGPSPKRASF